MAGYDGSIIFNTKLDNEELTGQLGGLESTIKKTLGAISVVAIGKGIVELGKSIINTGISFESAFADAVKTIDATDAEIATLRDEFRGMASEIPLAVEEIAGIGAAAGQLGIATENITGFTRVMADLGVATNLTSEQAATSLARLANITGMPQENFDRLGSTIVALGNNFATTESEITEMGLRLAASGKQAGMTEAEIMGIATAMSSLGMESQAGGSAMSRVISNIQLAVETGSKKLDEYANVAGMTGEQFQKAFKEDAAGAVSAFVVGLGDMERHGKSAIELLADMDIKERNMTDALLRASGGQDVFTNAIKEANQAWDENTALTAEAEQRYATLESKLVMLKNGVKDLGITIYDNMSGGLKQAADVATDALGRIGESMKSGELKKPMQDLGKAVGDAFVTIAQSVEKILPKIIKAATLIINNFDKILAAVKAFAAVKISQGIFSGFMKIVSPIQSAVDAVGKLSGTVINLGAGMTKTIGASAADLGSKLNPLTAIVGTLTGKFGAADAASTLFSNTLSAISSPVAGFTAALGLLAGAVILVVTNIGKASKETEAYLDEVNALADSVDSSISSWERATEAQRENIDNAVIHGEALTETAAKIDELASKAQLTAEEQAELNRLIGEANALDPELGLGYDEAAGSLYRLIDGQQVYLNNIEAVIAARMKELEITANEDFLVEQLKQRSEKMRELAKVQDEMTVAQEKHAAAQAHLNELQAQYGESSNIPSINNQLIDAQNEVNRTADGMATLAEKETELKEALGETNKAIGETQSTLYDQNKELAEYNSEAERSTKINRDNAAAALELAEATRGLSPASEEAQEKYAQLQELTGRPIGNTDDLEALISELKMLGPTTAEGIAEYNRLIETLRNGESSADDVAAAYARLSEIFGQEIGDSNINQIIADYEALSGAMYNIPDAETAARLQALADKVNEFGVNSSEAGEAFDSMSKILGEPIDSKAFEKLEAQLAALPEAASEAGAGVGTAFTSAADASTSGSSVDLATPVNNGVQGATQAATTGGAAVSENFIGAATQGGAGGSAALKTAWLSKVNDAGGGAALAATSQGNKTGKAFDDSASSGVKGGKLQSVVINTVDQAIAAARAKSAGASAIGTAMVGGMEGAIKAAGGKVVVAMANMVTSALAAARSKAGVRSPSKITYYYGEMIVQGMTDGITDNAIKAQTSAANMMLSVTMSLRKTILSALTETEKDLKKQGENLTKWQADIDKELAKVQAEREKAQAAEKAQARKDDLANLEKELKDAKAMKSKTNDEIKARNDAINKALKALNDAKEKYRREDAENARKAREDELTAEKEFLEGLQKQYEQILSDFEKAKDDYIKSYESGQTEILRKQESFAKKLIDAADLMETTTRGRRGTVALTDLNAQANEIRAYGERLAELMQRGLPDSVLEEIGAMSMEDAQKYMEALNHLTDAEYKDYMQAWEQRQAEADRVAALFYTSEQQKLETQHNKNMADLQQGLTKAMAQFQKDSVAAASKAGYSSGEAYIKGILQSINSAGSGGGLGTVILDSMLKAGGNQSTALAAYASSALGLASSSTVNTNTTTTVNHVLTFDTSWDDVARVLKPKLDNEVARAGLAIVQG